MQRIAGQWEEPLSKIPRSSVTEFDNLMAMVQNKLENSNILGAKNARVYFRPSKFISQVIILVNNPINNEESEFWYNFISDLEESCLENVIFSVGNPALWNNEKQIPGWTEFQSLRVLSD